MLLLKVLHAAEMEAVLFNSWLKIYLSKLGNSHSGGMTQWHLLNSRWQTNSHKHIHTHTPIQIQKVEGHASTGSHFTNVSSPLWPQMKLWVNTLHFWNWIKVGYTSQCRGQQESRKLKNLLSSYWEETINQNNIALTPPRRFLLLHFTFSSEHSVEE